MLVYRLAKEKYIRDLSGTGARLYGGRWNKKGIPLLYTSEHTSLAVLELLVHTPHTLLPNAISLLTIFIPDAFSIPVFNQKELPDNWQQYPAPDSLAGIGTDWAKSGKSLALKVPSVIVRNEYNILINPDHPHFQEISIESVSPFQLDSRF